MEYLETQMLRRDYISLFQPTHVECIISKAQVYWGVNSPLPPTQLTVRDSNDALPLPQAPGTLTNDLILPIEELRENDLAYWN